MKDASALPTPDDSAPVHPLRREWRPMLALAGPVVLAELGWMAMGTVDTLMVGRLGPEAIGAVGIGSSLFLVPAIFAIGLLWGLDTFVSQAFGAGRRDECRRWLVQGVHLSLLLTAPLTAIGLWLLLPALRLAGLEPEVEALTLPYLETVTWSLLPLLLYTTFRRYLQAIGRVAPVTFALLSANLVNVAVNWVLIFGKLGAPALGVEGAAWATVISRCWMALVLFAAIAWPWRGERRAPHERPALRPEPERLLPLARLGLPAALQVTLEVGVFALATALAGRLDAISLAAHQIALTAASVTFMVPLGVSSAGAVRVGQAVGRRDPEGAAWAGWTALLVGTSFMASAALVFVLLGRVIVGGFTTDPVVIATGARLLLLAAAFQLFDGLQVVSTGILRGLGDTRTPMLCNLVGHWGVGLPLGWALCFPLGWGVFGLWVGLSAGLIGVGAVLLRVWSRRVRRLPGAVATLARAPAFDAGAPGA